MQYSCNGCSDSVAHVPPSVKTRSAYRQQQAAATRERVLEAARALFARDGYGGTSMDAIAVEAGVGARTVYAIFGTKREILSAICERWLEQAGARERAAEVFAEPDPRLRLSAAAGWLAGLYAADFEVVLIFEAATDESPETRELLRAKLAGRNEVMDAMIASLGDTLTVPVPEAQAVFRAYAASGVYRELVHDAGWSPERFTRWLAGTLERDLFGDGIPDDGH
jgi:AcrR family transcriptional regulator